MTVFLIRNPHRAVELILPLSKGQAHLYKRSSSSHPNRRQLIGGLRHAALTNFMRVDFMWADGRLHACEMTPYPGSGYGRFEEHWVTDTFMRLWDLRRSWFLSTPQPGWRGAYAEALREAMDRQAD